MNKDIEKLKILIKWFKSYDYQEITRIVKALLAVYLELDEEKKSSYEILENAIDMYWEAEWIRTPFNTEITDYIENKKNEYL